MELIAHIKPIVSDVFVIKDHGNGYETVERIRTADLISNDFDCSCKQPDCRHVEFVREFLNKA